MIVTQHPDVPDVYRIALQVHHDDRGFFVERWSEPILDTLTLPPFVQENHSRSHQGVIRGLHYQGPPHSQGKLVSAVHGRVFDVAVDLRTSSATFGRWAGATLDGDEPAWLWIPPGFAHGFLTLSEHADVLYKVTAGYAPDAEGGLAWDDPDVGIDWPLGPNGRPILSPKDARWPRLHELRSPF